MNNQKFWKEFIVLYQNLPALWDTLSAQYRERCSKIEACDIMLEKLREFDPAATRCDVMRKINIFRTNYRRERARINLSRKEGRMYQTTLWYYDLLKFLENNSHKRGKRHHVSDHHDVNTQKILRNKTNAPPDSTAYRKKLFDNKEYLIAVNDYVIINDDDDDDDDNDENDHDDNIVYTNNSYDVTTPTNFNNIIAMKEITENINDENDVEQQYFSTTQTDAMCRGHDGRDVDDDDDDGDDDNDHDIDVDEESSTYSSYIAEDDMSQQLQQQQQQQQHLFKTEIDESIDDRQQSMLFVKCEQQNKQITSSSKNFTKLQQNKQQTSIATTEGQTSNAAEILAKSWALQYDEMSDNQKIFARKAIADILFQGCLGNLGYKNSTETKIKTSSTTTTTATPTAFNDYVENHNHIDESNYYNTDDDNGDNNNGGDVDDDNDHHQSNLNNWVVDLN